MGSTCSRTEATYWAISTNTPSSPRNGHGDEQQSPRCRGFTAHLRCPLRPASTERRLVRTRGPREDPSAQVETRDPWGGRASRVPSAHAQRDDGQILPGLVVLLASLSCSAVVFFQVGKASFLRSQAQTARRCGGARRRQGDPAPARGAVGDVRQTDLTAIDQRAVVAKMREYARDNESELVARGAQHLRPPTSRPGRAASARSRPRVRRQPGRQGHGAGAGARGALGRRPRPGRSAGAAAFLGGSRVPARHPARMGGAGAQPRRQAARLPGHRRARRSSWCTTASRVAERPPAARRRRGSRGPAMEPPSRLQRQWARSTSTTAPGGNLVPAELGRAGPDRRAAAPARLQHDLEGRRRARQPHAHRPGLLRARRRRRRRVRPARWRTPLLGIRLIDWETPVEVMALSGSYPTTSNLGGPPDPADHEPDVPDGRSVRAQDPARDVRDGDRRIRRSTISTTAWTTPTACSSSSGRSGPGVRSPTR